VLQNLEQDVEEAAATLGASRFRTLIQIIAPTLLPTIITGFALSFARGLGEYGSITFVSGNLPFKTEIVPTLIVYQLEEHNYAGATAIASVLLVASFIILALINWLEVWTSRFNQN
jgi:sulfate transport system permease protein